MPCQVKNLPKTGEQSINLPYQGRWHFRKEMTKGWKNKEHLIRLLRRHLPLKGEALSSGNPCFAGG